MGCNNGKQQNNKKIVLDVLNGSISKDKESLKEENKNDLDERVLTSFNKIIEKEGFEQKINHIQLLYEKLLQSEDGGFDQRSLNDPGLDDFLETENKGESQKLERRQLSYVSMSDIAREQGEMEIVCNNPIINKVLMQNYRQLHSTFANNKTDFSFIKGKIQSKQLNDSGAHSVTLTLDSSLRNQKEDFDTVKSIEQNGEKDFYNNMSNVHGAKNTFQKLVTVASHFDVEEDELKISQNQIKKSTSTFHTKNIINSNNNELLSVPNRRGTLMRAKTQSINEKQKQIAASVCEPLRQRSPSSVFQIQMKPQILQASVSQLPSTKDNFGEIHALNSVNGRSSNLNDISFQEIDQDFKESSLKPQCHYSHLFIKSQKE